MLWQVLNNGLLVDPHDQHAIADALYRLLSEKQLWSKCRENGLKNIHQFSWPEHCKNYLSRILTLSPRCPGFASNEDQIKAPIKGRKYIVVIAVDSASKKDLSCIIRNSIEATRTETSSASTGFVLSTSLTIAEIHSLVLSAGMVPTDFDAFICNSGSDLFYPSQAGDSPSTSRVTFALDRNYQSHIEYHWGGEGLRKYLVKWASSVVERRGRMEKQVIFEDSEHSSTCCLAFRVVNPNYVSLFFQISSGISWNYACISTVWTVQMHCFMPVLCARVSDYRWACRFAVTSFKGAPEIDESPVTSLPCSL
jgi:sucrose-phosphate synthase